MHPRVRLGWMGRRVAQAAVDGTSCSPGGARVGALACRLDRQVAPLDEPRRSVRRAARRRADHRLVVGKIPTTSVRRPISLLTRSSGFVERSLVQCSDGSCRRVRSSSASRAARIPSAPLQPFEHVPDARAGLLEALGVEHLAQRGATARAGRGGRHHHVAEGGRAALPRAARTRAIAALSPSC